MGLKNLLFSANEALETLAIICYVCGQSEDEYKRSVAEMHFVILAVTCAELVGIMDHLQVCPKKSACQTRREVRAAMGSLF